MTLAERTRDAARAHPFLLAALRAGVCNYAAAARFLDVAGDPDAVATALRRFAEELPDRETDVRDARVRMKRGVGTGDADPLLAVGGVELAADAGDETAVIATGDVDAAALSAVLDRLAVAEVSVSAAGVAGGTLLVVVGERDGASALRAVESALDAVPA
ncbi:MAG: hypothetical protein ABEJ68_08020 [Halobacteriaceae archaeon]